MPILWKNPRYFVGKTQQGINLTYYLAISTLGMEYSYAIIDPDTTSNLQMQLQLREYEDLYFTGSAENPAEALNLILKRMPDLVLVNLNHSAQLVFAMVAELHQYLESIPLLIGIAASKDKAYDAIKCGFFDYWLSPSNEFEIRKTIYKLRKQLPKEQLPATLCLKTYNDYHYLNTNEILYLKADNNSTDFYLRSGEKVSAYKTLKAFEKALPKNFIRVHQSYILNTKFVTRINYGKCTCSIRNIENQLPFSKTYRDRIDELKALLSKNSIKTLN